MWVGTNSFMSSQSFSKLITVNLQYNSIKITKQCSDVNCVKSIRIRGWSGPHFAIFWVNTGTCSVNLHTQPRCGKKSRTRKNSEHRHFPHSGQVLWFISLNLFLCLHLEISSFLWFRRLFPWCSMINSFSFKHK